MFNRREKQQGLWVSRKAKVRSVYQTESKQQNKKKTRGFQHEESKGNMTHVNKGQQKEPKLCVTQDKTQEKRKDSKMKEEGAQSNARESLLQPHTPDIYAELNCCSF